MHVRFAEVSLFNITFLHLFYLSLYTVRWSQTIYGRTVSILPYSVRCYCARTVPVRWQVHSYVNFFTYYKVPVKVQIPL